MRGRTLELLFTGAAILALVACSPEEAGETDDGETTPDASDTSEPPDTTPDTAPDTTVDAAPDSSVPNDVADTGSPGDTTDAEGPDTSPDSGANPCSGNAHGTPAQIASTPRSNTKLEQLALRLSSDVVAPQNIYDRVVRDVSKIKNNYSSVSNITYRPLDDGKSVNFGVKNGQTKNAIMNGNYTAWDCLNQHYVRNNLKHLFGKTFTLELKGIYDMKVVASDYASLPGFEYAEANGTVGDGPTICAERRGDVYHYVFDDASGDCPSGCINHDYTYFTVDPSGNVTKKGEWKNSQGNKPQWVSICSSY